jgi:hypothetical protein
MTNSNPNVNSYSMAFREAQDKVTSIVNALMDEPELLYSTDIADFLEYAYEYADNALIYTNAQWVCAYGLPESECADEYGPFTSFGDALTKQAYANLLEAVLERLEGKLEERMQSFTNIIQEHNEPLKERV